MDFTDPVCPAFPGVSFTSPGTVLVHVDVLLSVTRSLRFICPPVLVFKGRTVHSLPDGGIDFSRVTNEGPTAASKHSKYGTSIRVRVIRTR